MSRIRGPYVRFCERDEAAMPHPTRCASLSFHEQPLIFDAMVDNVIPMRISPADAKKRIVEAAKDSSRVRLSTHARERCHQRDITMMQIRRCLMLGSFTELPHWDQIHGNYKFTIRSMDAGELISVAAALKKNHNGDYVLVVTTF